MQRYDSWQMYYRRPKYPDASEYEDEWLTDDDELPWDVLNDENFDPDTGRIHDPEEDYYRDKPPMPKMFEKMNVQGNKVLFTDEFTRTFRTENDMILFAENQAFKEALRKKDGPLHDGELWFEYNDYSIRYAIKYRDDLSSDEGWEIKQFYGEQEHDIYCATMKEAVEEILHDEEKYRTRKRLNEKASEIRRQLHVFDSSEDSWFDLRIETKDDDREGEWIRSSPVCSFTWREDAFKQYDSEALKRVMDEASTDDLRFTAGSDRGWRYVYVANQRCWKRFDPNDGDAVHGTFRECYEQSKALESPDETGYLPF